MSETEEDTYDVRVYRSCTAVKAKRKRWSSCMWMYARGSVNDFGCAFSLYWYLYVYGTAERTAG